MRIVLVTGKGGVGKTTVAAATALACADRGISTLISSTDPAHSLADAFAVPLSDTPVEVAPGLAGQQIDTNQQMERSWGAIRDQLKDVFDWGGVDSLTAEEFLIFPGMDELFALLEVNRLARSGDYDAVIVDCAPTAETLRLLSLPEVLSWYFERVFPTERRIMRAARPVLNRITDLPIPQERMFDAAQDLFGGIEAMRELLSNPAVSSARLVINPERMVIDEARRTYTYLSLFGYGVDGVIVNRIYPEEVAEEYFARWREIQADHLDTIDEAFSEVTRLRLRLFDREMVGVPLLRVMAEELYGDVHPLDDLVASDPFHLATTGGNVVLTMNVPFAQKEDVDVVRHGEELYLSVGTYRRSLLLPDSLKNRDVSRARLEQGQLSVTFVDR